MASIYKRGGKKNRDGVYWITFYPSPGLAKTVRGCADKGATEALARKLEADAMLRREGIIDAKADGYSVAEVAPLVTKDAAGKIVGGHLADFHAALLAKGVTAKQADLVRGRTARVIELCGAERISGLTPSAVQGAIGQIREAPKSKESKLTTSLQTCNHVLRAVKQFSRWLWRDGRSREDALAHLTGYNVKLDRRHDRRALSDEEIARLLDAAATGPAVLDMTGADRAMLYRLALGTGFRAGELASLTPGSFDLDADTPTVTIEAAYSKHRRQDVQPIRRDLADLLKPWLEGKAAGVPVFAMPDKPVKLMQADLSAARQAWLEEVQEGKAREEREQSTFLAYQDGSGRVADFHSLRHCYISRLVQSGASVKVAQELARHSTPTLTLGRYAHIQLVDRTRALDALPAIDSPAPDRQEARATGTYDAAPVPADLAAPASARRAHLTPRGANTGENRRAEVAAMGRREVLENTGNREQALTPDTTTPGRIRTGDLRFRKPLPDSGKDGQVQELREEEGQLAAQGTARSAENRPATPADADLARIIDAWPTLPEAVKAGILAMVAATGKGNR